MRVNFRKTYEAIDPNTRKRRLLKQPHMTLSNMTEEQYAFAYDYLSTRYNNVEYDDEMKTVDLSFTVNRGYDSFVSGMKTVIKSMKDATDLF